MREPLRRPWKGKMTPRERFNRQMSWRSVDRSFNMEFGYWDENFKEWDIFVDNNIKSTAEANVFFGFDPYFVYKENFFMSPLFEEKIIDIVGNKHIIQNKDGLIAEVAADSHSTIPHYIKSPVRVPADWDRLKKERFDVRSPDRIIDVEAVRQTHPADRDYPLGIHCGSMIGRIRDLLTFEGLCYAWFDYPDMLEDMVETCCVIVENILDQILGKVEFDFAAGWEDICFNYGPILPPEFFTEIVAPRYKRISRRLRKHGIDLWHIDCDGDVRVLLPIFLESGINCLLPYEVNSCAHPRELLEQYEGRLRLMGGVDKMCLKAGPEAIKSYLYSLVPCVENGGYIPFCDHLCPPDVDPKNYLYYLDLKKELFGMD